MTTSEPDFDGDEWQRGFHTGYRLGFVRGRLVAWIAYLKRIKENREQHR